MRRIGYLNLRENFLKDLIKVANFKKYGKLTKIVLEDTPMWTSQEQAREVLIFMPRLEEVNKQKITDVDRQVAYNIASERFRIVEAAR